MKNRRPTSFDVAKLAGVSRSTVSLVLNDRTDVRIPEATREKVRSAARELGYVQNASARALATGRTGRIGVLTYNPTQLPDRIDDSFHETVISGILGKMLELGYDALLHLTDPTEHSGIVRHVRMGGADGLVIVGLNLPERVARELERNEFPVVYCFEYPATPGFRAIDADNVTAGRLAAEHLCGLGHRRISFIEEPNKRYSLERWRGLSEQVSAAGGVCDRLVPRREAWEIVQEDMARLIKESSSTALVCDTEYTAFSVLALARELGIRVPEDLSVVGFNSTVRAEQSDPPLTCVRLPIREVGETAIGQIDALVRGEDVARKIVRLPVRLDLRQTTAAPRSR